MTDLNLAATVSDGGGTGQAFHNFGGSGCTYANDGNAETFVVSDSGVHIPFESFTRILKTDLGSSQSVDAMVVYGSQDGGSDPLWDVEHSADGSSWTPVTGYSHVWTVEAGLEDYQSDMTFDAVSARYWRLKNSKVYGDGYGYYASLNVTSWQIGEGDPPDPPPDPEPGVGVGLGDEDDEAFVDVSAYVRRYRITRGASAEVVGGATVGSAWIELNNPGDIFNPLNASGPYFGLLRDGKRLWIGPNVDGAWTGSDPRGLFGGRTQDWTPIPQGGATYSPTVELTGEDCLGWYARTQVRVPDAIGLSHADLRSLMLDRGGETRTDLAHEILTMPLSSFDGKLLDGLEAINKVNGTRHWCKPENDRADWYTYTTRNRQWRLDATVDAELNADPDHMTTDGWRLSADTVTNQQKATVDPLFFTPSSTVVWEAEGLPWGIWHNFDKTVWIEFDDFVKAPAVSINYSGGTISATLTSFGRTAKIVLHYGGVGIAQVTSLKVSGSLARRGIAVSVVEDDTASQAGTRGVRAGSDISGDLVGVLANAQGIAAHIVWRYADPQFRPTVKVINWLPDQFDIDLYDIVSISVDELQMADRLFEVVGLTHEGEWAADGDLKHLHITTYVLQECRVQEDPGWFVLDTSELDDTPVLAY